MATLYQMAAEGPAPHGAEGRYPWDSRTYLGLFSRSPFFSGCERQRGAETEADHPDPSRRAVAHSQGIHTGLLHEK